MFALSVYLFYLMFIYYVNRLIMIIVIQTLVRTMLPVSTLRVVTIIVTVLMDGKARIAVHPDLHPA
jgi:hypothetical protein